MTCVDASLCFVCLPQRKQILFFFLSFSFPSLLAVWQRKRGGFHSAPSISHCFVLWALGHVEK
jgi:hypothetical protein